MLSLPVFYPAFTPFLPRSAPFLPHFYPTFTPFVPRSASLFYPIFTLFLPCPPLSFLPLFNPVFTPLVKGKMPNLPRFTPLLPHRQFLPSQAFYPGFTPFLVLYACRFPRFYPRGKTAHFLLVSLETRTAAASSWGYLFLYHFSLSITIIRFWCCTLAAPCYMQFVRSVAPPHRFVVANLCTMNICVCTPYCTNPFHVDRRILSKAARQ